MGICNLDTNLISGLAEEERGSSVEEEEGRSEGRLEATKGVGGGVDGEKYGDAMAMRFGEEGGS
ncbi:hypothetical protein COLO4_08551 [Corchorus olitorius]|uniref:Uncharacterized protein n=1 Tax=Corchorus olitorius TaxID=93759 RepID=A0A1R3KFH1_9ROSI|nr:hypothetical protein COLO4_08551 [Corchorus olitorius]